MNDTKVSNDIVKILGHVFMLKKSMPEGDVETHESGVNQHQAQEEATHARPISQDSHNVGENFDEKRTDAAEGMQIVVQVHSKEYSGKSYPKSCKYLHKPILAGIVQLDTKCFKLK